MDKMRDEFEAWAKSSGQFFENYCLTNDGCYDDQELNFAWLGWQAARAQPAGEAVAWIWRFPDGDLYEIPFGTKTECEQECDGYDGEAIPLYTTPPAQVPDGGLK